MRLAYSPEPSPLGTAGALRRALPHLPSPTVLLLNGDSYCPASLPDFLVFHRRQAADLSLVLTGTEDCSRFGQVRVAPGGHVLGFEEKRQASGPGWINAGIYLINRPLIEEVPPDRPASLERDLFPAWAGRKRCFGYPGPAAFLDIGTPESYARAETFFTPIP
jgi:NDP-sugar pyrophosphorylase family protein